MKGPILDDWHDRASCRNKPTAWWYSELKDDNNQITPAARKALVKCFACPVRRACLRHALTYPEPYGIWGASTEHERRRVRSLMFAGALTLDEATEAAWDIANETGDKLGLRGRGSA